MNRMHVTRWMMTAAVAMGVAAGGAQEKVEETDEPEQSILDRYVDLDTELNLYSAYVWRGQILYSTPVWQPAVNVWLRLGENAEHGRIKLRCWSNFAIQAYKPPHRFGNMSIVDETVSYNRTFFDCLDLETGVIMYQFPNRHKRMRDTEEFLAGVRWRNPYITPRFYVWWDFDSSGHNPENMLLFDFDFTHSFALTKELSLNVGSGFGVANGPYMECYSKGGIDGAAFNFFHSDLGLYYRLTDNMKVGVSLTYFYNLSREVRHSAYDMHDNYNAGILRGGVHLVGSF